MRTYLYIIKYYTNPPTTKIGISFQLKKRIRALMSGSPVRLEYTYVKEFKDKYEAKQKETLMHNHFKKENIQGEIFGIDDKIAIQKAKELFGESDDLNQAAEYYVNTENAKSAKIINIEDFNPEYTKKEEIEELYKKLKNSFADDKFRINEKPKNINPKKKHLYDEIKNPLTEIFYNEIHPISLETAEIPRLLVEGNPNVKNHYFSEFLATISDSEGWELRESMKFHEEHKNELHCIGTGDKAKEWNTHRQIRKFRKKIEKGPNIMAIIDFYYSELADLFWENDDFKYDKDYPGYKRFQPPLAFSFGNHETMGPTVNFWILDDEWLKDANTFGRTVPEFRNPCTEYILGPLGWLFDYYGYAPFIHTVYKPDEERAKKGIQFQCDIKFGAGHSFGEDIHSYYHCYGMNTESSIYASDAPDPEWEYKGNWMV